MSRRFQGRNFCPRSSAIDPSTAMSWLVKRSQPSERFEPKLLRQRNCGRPAARRLVRNSWVGACTTWDGKTWDGKSSSRPAPLVIAKLLLGSPLRPALSEFLADLVAVVPDRVHGVA